MLRKFIVLPLVAAAALMANPATEAAPPLSPNNPYRSFNISGVNYGSLKWEQSRGNGRNRSMNYGGARLFRRR